MFLFALSLLLALLAPRLSVAAPTSLFEMAGKPQDVGSNILDFVFGGSGGSFSDVAAARLHNALQTLFTYYSGAMLIIAALIVAYHLIVMVAETAHYGVAMGKRGKQIWSPIRLILGLGLLVPVAGFGSAQYLMMQMTRMGSSLASNAWNAFADEIKTKKITLHGSANIDPTATIAHFVAIGLCVKSYEIIYSGMPTERLLPFVMNNPYLVLKEENGNSVARTIFQAKLGLDNKFLPVTCGEMSWLEPDLLRDNTTMNKVSQRFSKAHLEAIRSIQTPALDLGGSLALGTLGIFNGSEGTYVARFAKLVDDYKKSFLTELEGDKITIDKYGNVQALSAENTAPIGGYGWLMAGTTLQKFALTDTMLITPELSVPVVNFHYPLFAAVNDKATLQLARSLSFAHILLQPYSAEGTTGLWFNPTIDHGKGPVKQALTLTANIVARHEQAQGGRTILDTGISAGSGENIGLFKPIALGFKALELADQFWAVAEWSPRANSPVFGPAIIFGNLAHAVKAALLAANPKFDTALLGPQNMADIDQPADFARLLLAVLGVLLFIPALLLAFVLPLIPMLHFAYGGLLWLMAVFQGLAAAPIWALTFLSVKGDDIMPPGSRIGVLLILNIFLRPILMIVGFITALLLMHVGFGVLELSLQLFSYDGLQGSKTLYSLGNMALLIANLLLSFAITNGSMKCISLFPEFTLRWIGVAAGGDGANAAAQIAAAGAAGSETATTATPQQAAIAGVAGSISAMQNNQQVWQRKLLGVLEQIAEQNGGGSRSTQNNAGLFAHLQDKPDQARGDSANAVQGTNSAAATVNVATGGIGSTIAGATTHVQHTDKREEKMRDTSEKNALMAQTIRGNPTDKS